MAFVAEKIPESGPEREWLDSFGWDFLEAYIVVEHGRWYIDRERKSFFLHVAAKKTGANIIERRRADSFHCAVKLVIGHDEIDIYAIKQISKNEAGRTVWNIQSIAAPATSVSQRAVVKDTIREICELLSPEYADVNFPLPLVKTSHLDMAAVLLRNMTQTIQFGKRFGYAIPVLWVLTVTILWLLMKVTEGIGDIIIGFAIFGSFVAFFALSMVHLSKYAFLPSTPLVSPGSKRYTQIAIFLVREEPWVNMPDNKYRKRWAYMALMMCFYKL
jgi:hypothetical protein